MRPPLFCRCKATVNFRDLLHLLLERGQRSGGYFELRRAYSTKQLCGFLLRHDSNMSTSFGANGASLCFTKVVAMLSAPTLVLLMNTLSDFSLTQRQCQNSATKSNHFSRPSLRIGLKNRRLPGVVPCKCSRKIPKNLLN